MFDIKALITSGARLFQISCAAQLKARLAIAVRTPSGSARRFRLAFCAVWRCPDTLVLVEMFWSGCVGVRWIDLSFVRSDWNARCGKWLLESVRKQTVQKRMVSEPTVYPQFSFEEMEEMCVLVAVAIYRAIKLGWLQVWFTSQAVTSSLLPSSRQPIASNHIFNFRGTTMLFVGRLEPVQNLLALLTVNRKSYEYQQRGSRE